MSGILLAGEVEDRMSEAKDLKQPIRLPIDAHLPALCAAVAAASAVIVRAEPGAGKTTRVPAALLDQVQGRIIVLEPRRLAARLSAERIASERGESVGGTVEAYVVHPRHARHVVRLLAEVPEQG